MTDPDDSTDPALEADLRPIAASGDPPRLLTTDDLTQRQRRTRFPTDGVPGTADEGGRRRWWLAGAAAMIVLAAAVAVTVNGGRASKGQSAFGDCAVPDSGPAALVAFDPATGAERWHQPVGQVGRSQTLGGLAVTLDASGLAVGRDVATGAIRWCRTLPIGSTHMQAPGFVAAGDVVATMAPGGDVVAIDAATGTDRWRVAAQVPESGSLVADDGFIYVTSRIAVAGGPAEPGQELAPPLASSPVLLALDASTGAVVPDAPAPPPDPPGQGGVDGSSRLTIAQVITPDRVELQLTVTDVASGAPRWDLRVPGMTAEIEGDSVVVIDQNGGTGEVLAFDDRPDTRVSAYDLTNGALRWRIPLPGTPQRTFFVNNTVVVPVDSTVYALEPATGATRWQVDHGSPGAGGTTTEAGTYRTFSGTSDPDTGDATVVGLIVAQEPYHD